MVWRISIHFTLPFYCVVLGRHVKTITSPLMATKLGRRVTHIDCLLPIKVKWPYNHVVLWDHVKNLKHCVSTTTMLIVTKLSRMVTYLEWLLNIKLGEHTITWFCKIALQTKIIIYPSTRCLWLWNNWGYKTWQGGYIE